jgi:hypothetical protein
MPTKKVRSTKKTPAKKVAAKTKKAVKSSKAKVALFRPNVYIPQNLHNKTKQFALKHNITIQEIITSSIKEYLNKPAVIENSSVNNSISSV